MRSASGPWVRLPARFFAAGAAFACLIASLAGAPPAKAAPQEEAQPRLIAPDRSALRGAGAVIEASPEVPGALLVTTEDKAGTAAAGAIAAPAVELTEAAGAEAQVTALAEGVARVVVDPDEADEVAERLASLPGVVAVEPERVWEYQAQTSPDDPFYDEQWAHRRTGVEQAWELTTGVGRRIVVIDSGIDGRHPELSDRIIGKRIVREVDGRYRLVATTRADNDECNTGHGTAVAGVAAAAGDNGVGVAGVAWGARIIDIALSTSGSCSPSDAKVIAALSRVAQGDFGTVDVVNLSLGGREPSGRCPSALQRAIHDVIGKGTVIVAAAGNEGYLDVNVPAACDGVITVGATHRDDTRAPYSGMSRYLDLVAPGGQDVENCHQRLDLCIVTTYRATETCAMPCFTGISGTSFAVPYVSGTIALLRSLNPGLSPRQIESVLELTAKHPRGSGVYDHEHGWGLVQAGAAARHVAEGKPIPVPREHPAVRIAAGSSTAPVTQAVAMSKASFRDGAAQHAVLARSDDFADALAGASLAYGIAPVLFTPPRGALAPETAAELRRVLAPGKTVYLLGGEAALDQRIEDDIRALGLRPKRVYGPTREWTAVAIAREVRALVQRAGQPVSPSVLVATRSNWPDAVAAGWIGSAFGVPVLLTPSGSLHSATRGYLETLGKGGDISTVYVVGGTGVVSEATARAAGEAAGPGSSSATVRRLGGAARDLTALAVAKEMRSQLVEADIYPPYGVAVDLDRPDGYAHALSASVLAGSMFSVMVPVRGPTAPQRITGATADAFCGLRADALLAGGTDLLPERLGTEFVHILKGSSPRC